MTKVCGAGSVPHNSLNLRFLFFNNFYLGDSDGCAGFKHHQAQQPWPCCGRPGLRHSLCAARMLCSVTFPAAQRDAQDTGSPVWSRSSLRSQWCSRAHTVGLHSEKNRAGVQRHKTCGTGQDAVLTHGNLRPELVPQQARCWLTLDTCQMMSINTSDFSPPGLPLTATLPYDFYSPFTVEVIDV